jgi:hypothetical protein
MVSQEGIGDKCECQIAYILLPHSVSEARLPDLHANAIAEPAASVRTSAKNAAMNGPGQAQGSWLPDDAWPLRSIDGGWGDSSTSG